MKTFIYLLFNICLLACSESEIKPIFNHSNTYEWNTQENDLLNNINSYRIDNNINELIPDDTHYTLALQRNNDNINSDEITHKDFPIVFKYLIDSGQEWAGENLAYGYSTTEGVLNAWIKAERHNTNLLREDWIYVGIKVTKYNNRKYYCILFSK